ncbi:AAA family ATPase [Haliangium sp.]|uniref:AAA family ATPase n=1 Tax=Haliangium sp. TaxID=2663208 RepID=UPI003D110256
MRDASRFDLLDPSARSTEERRERARTLAARMPPTSLRSHRSGAPFFQPSPDLVMAINIALTVQAPLLLTGEPGTGKTQVAHYLAWYFELEGKLFVLDVRSTTTTADLLYRFDTVAYFHAAQDPTRAGETLDRGRYIDRGPLWLAFETEGPSLVLIDEIDKAPRDFPNDLLNVLDQHRFTVPDLPHEGTEIPVIELGEGKAPPLVVITSNSERRLPEPFLRRCIFHHIEFTVEVLRKAMQAHEQAFPYLDEEVRELAVERFIDIRRLPLRKKPATAEFLVWLSVLSAQGGVTAAALCRPLDELPALATLIKDRDDLSKL